MPSIKYLVYIIHDHWPRYTLSFAYYSLFLVPPNYINNAANSLMKQSFTEHSVCSKPWNNLHQK